MNYESRLISLKRLKSQIQEATKSRAMDATKSYDAGLSSKVEGWTQQIAIAQKQIKSGHHLNALQFGQMRFAQDRSARYGARQRFHTKDRQLETLYILTVEIALALGDFLAQKGPEKNAESVALEAIAKSLEKIMKSISTDSQTMQEFGLGSEQQTITASVRQLERTSPGPATTPGVMPVLDLFTLILAYFAFIKAMRK